MDHSEVKKEGAKSPLKRERSIPLTCLAVVDSSNIAATGKRSRHASLLSAIQSIQSSATIKKETPENEWRAKRQLLLDSIQNLQDKPSVPAKKEEAEGKEKSVSSAQMKMNVQLMRGELPQVYSDLLTRFTVVDIFLKRNYPKMVLLSNIHNYLILSDCKLSFLEDHVRSIVYLYAYGESDQEAYRMGRTKPKMATELSILTLRLPHVEKPTTVKDQIIDFLGSSRNLNGVFVAMKEEGRKTDLLKDRSSQLKKHIEEYIAKQYEAYLERVGEKKPAEGRSPGFTMDELGEMPKGAIPPPLKYVEKTAEDRLKELQVDVDKAIREKTIAPSSPRKSTKVYRGFELDLRSL